MRGDHRELPRRLPRGAEVVHEQDPRTRLWKIRFFGDEDDEFEEYNAEELAKHLRHRAHDEGARGPPPEAGSEQLTAFLKARAAAAAEEEDEEDD